MAFTCQTLMNYVRIAYGRSVDQSPIGFVGGPPWVNKDLYRIEAKASDGASTAGERSLMMQALLEERFKLKVHHETRQVPVYALVLTKAGVRLPAAKRPCFKPNLDKYTRPDPAQGPPPMCGMGVTRVDGIEVHGSTMAQFCVALSRAPLQLSRRKFIDKTGITGQFDFDLKFAAEDSEPAAVTAAPQASGLPVDDFPRLQGALSRVGLKLVPANGADDFIVIDHAERPTPN